MKDEARLKNGILFTPASKPLIHERLLHYLWQHQYFDRTNLQTTNGEELIILNPGQLNANQGPDFTNAQIRIGGTTLVGTVELHVQSSDWDRHGHSEDLNYRNVILHVVWEEAPARGLDLPMLELKGLVSSQVIKRYEAWMNSPFQVACGKGIQQIPSLHWEAWKDRLVSERWIRRAEKMKEVLQSNKGHWEEMLWWMLAANFGAKVNKESFEAIARSLPLKLILKHANQIHQLEAFLLGQAGLLSSRFSESYPILLQKEYKFLAKKYSLKPVPFPIHFLRMRPMNFPTVRLAQLAAAMQAFPELFPLLLATKQTAALRKWLNVTANDYWHYHYRLDEASSYKQKILGKEMINSVIINTFSACLFAYGWFHSKPELQERALQWLHETPPESNTVTRSFKQLGITSKSALDSQALLELKTSYCDPRYCLRCAVGNFLLRPGKT